MNTSMSMQRINSGLEASTSRPQIVAHLPRSIPRCVIPFTSRSNKYPSRRHLRKAPFAGGQQDPETDLFFTPSVASYSPLNGNNKKALGSSAATATSTASAISSPSSANGVSSSSQHAHHSSSQNSSSSSNGSKKETDVLIEFKDVYKSFGSKQILRGASFKIRRGEAVGIIGSSGTGKSTALRLAAGLLQPDAGQVLVKGEPRQGLLSDDDTSDKLKVGLVFQSGALFDSLTVKQNVGFMLYEHSSLPEWKIEAAVASSLGKVGLSGVEDLYPSELSGGMKKRVALARAIVTDADFSEENGAEQLIMYDEPTAGLDPVASTVIEDLIRNMHEPNSHPEHGPRITGSGSSHDSLSSTTDSGGGGGGGITSYVVVTHQHSTIRRAVDRIIFLHEGKVAWEGSVAEFDTTDEPIVRQFASGSLKGPIVYE